MSGVGLPRALWGTVSLAAAGKHSGRECRLTISWLVGLVVAYVLLMSAIPHIRNPYAFLATVRSYGLLPRRGAETVALVLPFLHLTVALCLIGRQAQAAAFRVGAALFATYAGAQATTLARGMKLDCGCFAGFGAQEAPRLIGAGSISLAAGLSLVCLLGCWTASAQPGPR